MQPAMLIPWQIQDAKNRFSQVVKAAVAGVPQSVTVHGKLTAVVISADAYAKLKRPPQNRLLDDLLMPGLMADDEAALFERDMMPTHHRDVLL